MDGARGSTIASMATVTVVGRMACPSAIEHVLVRSTIPRLWNWGPLQDGPLGPLEWRGRSRWLWCGLTADVHGRQHVRSRLLYTPAIRPQHRRFCTAAQHVSV